MKSIQALNRLEDKVDKLDDLIQNLPITKSEVAVNKMYTKVNKFEKLLKLL